MGSMTPYASATLLGCIVLGVKILDNPRVGISCKTAGLDSVQSQCHKAQLGNCPRLRETEDT